MLTNQRRHFKHPNYVFSSFSIHAPLSRPSLPTAMKRVLASSNILRVKGSSIPQSRAASKKVQQTAQQQESSKQPPEAPTSDSEFPDSQQKTEKTQAEKDAELREKLEAMSGGGGEAGLELENGQPVAMKRGVRENMFRLI